MLQERSVTIRLPLDVIHLMQAIAMATGQVLGSVFRTAIERFIEEAKKDEDLIRKVEEFRHREAEVFAGLLGIKID